MHQDLSLTLIHLRLYLKCEVLMNKKKDLILWGPNSNGDYKMILSRDGKELKKTNYFLSHFSFLIFTFTYYHSQKKNSFISLDKKSFLKFFNLSDTNVNKILKLGDVLKKRKQKRIHTLNMWLTYFLYNFLHLSWSTV